MDIPIALGRHTRIWRLLDGPRLAQWLADEPWHECAAPLVVHIPEAHQEGFVDGIRGELRRQSAWGDEVALDHLAGVLCARGAEAALWQWMGLVPSSRRRLAETFARLARRRPRLLVAEIPPTAEIAPWLDELSVVLDIHAKLPDRGRAAVIAICSSRAISAGGWRLDLGWPSLSHDRWDDEERWGAYLHERVAWHVASRLDLVGGLSRHLQSLPVGDDAGLEDALDTHSRALVEELPDALGRRLRVDLTPILHDPRLQQCGPMASEAGRVLRPAAWLARGLVDLYPQHHDRRFLEALIVCRPLANRLLGRCLELEQRVRDRLLRSPPAREPDADIARRIERLARDGDAVEHQLVPRGRLRLDGGWEVAQFGELIHAISLSSVERSRFHTLRRVRNALAHGSPVGWRAIAIVRRLETELDA